MDAEIVTTIVNGVVTVVGLHELVRYSLGRKFRNDPAPSKRTWRMWFDRWRIEIIFAAVLVPQWADWAPALLSLIPGVE